MSPRAAKAAKPATSPRPAQVLSLRLGAALTQREAAGLLHTTDRVWRQWEAGDRHMHPAFWELFQLKALAQTGTRLIAADDEACAECERSHGPHYRGRCPHGEVR